MDSTPDGQLQVRPGASRGTPVSFEHGGKRQPGEYSLAPFWALCCSQPAPLGVLWVYFDAPLLPVIRRCGICLGHRACNPDDYFRCLKTGLPVVGGGRNRLAKPQITYPTRTLFFIDGKNPAQIRSETLFRDGFRSRSSWGAKFQTREFYRPGG